MIQLLSLSRVLTYAMGLSLAVSTVGDAQDNPPAKNTEAVPAAIGNSVISGRATYEDTGAPAHRYRIHLISTGVLSNPRLPHRIPTAATNENGEFTNTGVKKIREIVWEYVTLDPSSGSEVGRRRFTSTVSVGGGKSTTLFGYSTLPPTGTIDARSAGEKPEGQHSERVVIMKIVYDDYTVWEL